MAGRPEVRDILSRLRAPGGRPPWSWPPARWRGGEVVARLLGHKFLQAVLATLVAFLFFRFGIQPPIPQSLLNLYMLITLFAILLFISSNEAWWREFQAPAQRLLLEREDRRIVGLRWVVVALLPLLVGWVTWGRVNPRLQPPAELRAIHPAPPNQIDFRGEQLRVQGLENPLREGGVSAEELEHGQRVYYQNCVYCHGDALDGDGHFADAFNPRPADFRDSGTIAQLQESYVFWRVAKGGPGLPKESAPWNSAMPAWEDRLSQEDVWSVILWLYHGAGVQPRTAE